MLSLTAISAALSDRPVRHFAGEERTRAAVAMILRSGRSGPEVLFIERARHDRDPWSGDLGFPGGKVEADESSRMAAERETREEIGMDLGNAACLGRLDDLAGAHLPIIVSCFVYAVEGEPDLRFNHEVAAAFWFSVAALREPRRHVAAPVRFADRDLRRPALRLLEADRPVLWGITYRLVSHFLDLLGRPLPPLPAPAPGGSPAPDDLVFASSPAGGGAASSLQAGRGRGASGQEETTQPTAAGPERSSGRILSGGRDPHG